MNNNIEKLSHIDKEGKAKMVDVSEKEVTTRTAIAQSVVVFPADIYESLSKNNFLSSKGSIIQTAVIAGTMAAKKTAELIPLCHPLPISNININISTDENSLKIEAKVKCSAKTGVEMEALTAASIAALTVYDMCKALSHNIVIAETKLIAKEGGKHVFSK